MLTSNHEKLQKDHEKLLSAHKDLVVSHHRLKLANEVIASKVISIEPHLDSSTKVSKNALLSYANPCNSSNANTISCDELFITPCCSNTNVSPRVSIDANFVEEISELKG